MFTFSLNFNEHIKNMSEKYVQENKPFIVGDEKRYTEQDIKTAYLDGALEADNFYISHKEDRISCEL